MINRWKVLQEHSGLSLLAFLKEMLDKEVSAKQVKRDIDAGKCLLNGKPERFSSRLVGTGDKVEFTFSQTPKVSHEINFEDSQSILYSDHDLLAFNKPSGIASDSKDLLESLQKRFGPIILLHRLDKETTGILLFARNEEAAKSMEALFKKRLVKKTYLAFINGIPTKNSGFIENYLGKLHVYQGQTVWGVVSSEKGLYARTAWEVIRKGKGVSLVICHPETGRTHQIRIHLSSIGHPILGDHQYGRSFTSHFRPNRILLHAAEINFEHPRTKESLTIKAAMPNDFLDAAERLWGESHRLK